MADNLDFLRSLLDDDRQSERESMSQAAVAAFVDGNTRQKQVAKRMDAQVDAMLRSKYAECGQPDMYQPPSEEDDDLSSTFINCKILGDQAVTQITDAMSNIAAPEPEQPQQPLPTRPRPKSGLAKALLGGLIGAAVVAGPIVTYLATMPKPTPGTDTQIILKPGDTSQIQRGSGRP